jgi:hypothetical protein
MSDSKRVVPVRPAAAPFVPLRGTLGVLREAKPLGGLYDEYRMAN